MGKDPDAIYREIAEHRDRMSRERADLQERLRSDLGGVRERFQERSPGAASGIGEQVSHHPLSYLSGGFGIGVVMGMLSPGIGFGGGGGQGRDGQRASRDGYAASDGGSSSGITGAVSSTLLSSFEDAVRPLMRDIMAGFRGDERPPERRDQSQ